jgi:hypothetical protein
MRPISYRNGYQGGNQVLLTQLGFIHKLSTKGHPVDDGALVGAASLWPVWPVLTTNQSSLHLKEGFF